MANAQINHRRDPRNYFPRGSTSISISPRTAFPPELTNVSAAGLSFIVGADAGIETGDELHEVTLRLGTCEVRGDICVRNVVRADDDRVSCGCLFYPASPAETERWMLVVNTVDAALEGA